MQSLRRRILVTMGSFQQFAEQRADVFIEGSRALCKVHLLRFAAIGEALAEG